MAFPKMLSGLIRLVALALILQACKIAYIPNTFNSPLLRNKGDAQLNIWAGSAGIEAQTAVAVTNSIGLMVNGQLQQNKKTENDVEVTEQRKYVEGAIGYTERFSDMGIFEFYAGGGVGQVPAKFRSITWDGPQTIAYNRWFIQPALGFCNDWLDFSVVSRLSLVDIGPQKNWFYEPGIVGKIGYKRLRFVGCFGLSIPLREHDKRYWDNLPFTISIGLHLNFGKRIVEN
ncbi:MAG: hypothetical protein WBJ36_02045 [Tenuifilum sp.]|jgi:hypothetical protein|uniref:hypothetical protein n=1 Tax=Tenuifilum sp. TaxID=2760880 RepID=UPI001B6D3278|nr:hypothetical protein [Bacteroidales bacterium]HOK61677.1 hypothetical protein [Tenuifilum sp.]HOK86966.1 hypothetical protein [Tenuifilum sp.]HON71619.1 hypothetical protein [Tenuifilum sp.]HPP90824.1 hypothetical protein [Tenuifilum sp.]